MLKIAVCDDNPKVLIQMKKYLTDFENLFQIQFYNSGEELLSCGKNFDFIFLDIDMKGISGIDTARMLRQRDRKAKIIYVTAYEDFRDHAFAVHAFAYLVKPVNKDKIQSVLREALEYTEPEISEPAVCFHTDSGLLDIKAKDICYFEYQNRKLRMVTVSGEYLISDSLHNMAKRVADYGFLMPHKSFIVNLYHIRNLKGYDIYMTDGSIVPLSQKKSADFRKKLAAWLASRI
ncbi:MAG: LytTR family DNA-binding domain-containing protein [Eubacteriales bacterium]|nr:LytTR family DNA-binding domain-containing protein [Eubacteriales bacterium]